MKDLFKRILLGIIVLLITMLVFSLAVNFLEEKEYKYLTLENECGISNNCYLENQYTFCYINGISEIVKQFYSEK